ncbi:hypothetical protein [Paraburkholderia caribensis]|uniref:hypothetical protein n=1 Tax=Paraburkholderia caribensis TaxID=75105 RepID=UPI001590BA29|nr:hypothetical protein [Paraburkholderia caribensis]
MAGKRQADDRSWFDLEVQGTEFPDTKLRRRFATLLETSELKRHINPTRVPIVVCVTSE